MMRRFLTILIVLLGITCANAQAVWISPDGYCQYAVIEFENTGADELKLTDRHRPALDYIDYLIDQFKDKIQTQEYQVWVESYVGDQEDDFAANRALARKMSNVVKSHIILNDGLVESNFKTRNYSGTFGGRNGVTIVVIGMRYPVEEIVPKQRLFYDQVNPDALEGIGIDVTFDSLGTQKVISTIGVDTLPVLYPNFKIMTFDAETLSEEQTEQGMIGNNTFTVTGQSKSAGFGSFGNDGVDPNNSAANASTAIPGLISDDSIHEPGLPKFWSTEDETTDAKLTADSVGVSAKSTTAGSVGAESRGSIIGVASGGVTALTPGAVTNIVEVAKAENPIALSSQDQSAASSSQKAKHQREVNKQIDEQFRLQKEQKNQDALLAKEQAKQQKIEEQEIARALRSGKTTAQGDNANKAGAVTVDGIVVDAVTGTPIMTFDRAAASTSPTSGTDKSSADQNQPSSIDQDPLPMPFGPLSNFGADRDKSVVVAPATTSKNRGQKNQPLDGKSVEEQINQAIMAEQKVADREQRIRKEQAVREIFQKQKVERLREIQSSKGRFPVAGIGVNVLSSAALIPSFQLDSYFSDRLSVAAEWYYSKWNYSPKNVFNISMGSLELRFFCMGKKKAFEGLYVGLYGGVGEYDFRWGTQEGHQSQFFTVGLSLGYVLPLGKSGFYFEAGISGGYVGERVEKYVNLEGNYVRINENFTNSTIFAPTKIKLSIIYRIFNQKK